MESKTSASWRAVREAVPLKSMCSMKWLMPEISCGSSRAPTPTQKPMVTLLTWGIRSVMMRMPLLSVVL
jgi:hypothetical protein